MITYENFIPKYMEQLTFEDDVLFATAFNMPNEASQFLKTVLNRNIFIDDIFRINNMELPEIGYRKSIIVVSNKDIYVLFIMPEGYNAQKYYEKNNQLIIDCVKNTYGVKAARCHYIAMTHLGNKSIKRETIQLKKDEVVLINMDYRDDESEFGKAMSDFTVCEPDQMQSEFMIQTMNNAKHKTSCIFLIKSLTFSDLLDALLAAANLLKEGKSIDETKAATKLSIREIERIQKLI